MDLKEMRDLRAAQLTESCGRLMQASATYTPAGVCMLKQAVPLTADAIRAYLKEYSHTRGVKPTAYEWLKRIPCEVASLVGCRRILDGIAITTGYPHLCLMVGRLICDEADLRTAINLNAAMRGRMKKIARNRASRTKRMELAKTEAKLGGLTFAERKTCLQVGAVFVQLFISATGLATVRCVTHTNGGRSVRKSNKIVAADGVMEWIRQFHERIPALMPVWMPMDTPPLPWVSNVGGGYGPQSGPGGRLVAHADAEQITAIENGAGKDAIKALNAVQAVPWMVDADVLEVAKAVWSEGHGVGGLPRREPRPFPVRPEPWIEGSDEVVNWKRQAAATASLNDTERSRSVATAKIIWAADRMLKASRFWFPMRFDFRGRIYPRPGQLQPQGCDLSRGLLRFADGRPMGSHADSEKWLAVHGANCFGVDKVTFAERVQWVCYNEQRILAVGENPIEERFWTEADEPWQFLAFCLEWWRYKQQGPTYVTHLPVAVDGSNNGLQLYALLTGSSALAKATNVLPSPTPQDIYGEVARRATDALRLRQGTASDEGMGATWLLAVAYPKGLPRKLVKRSVMTLPYGVSKYSSSRYVADFIREDCSARGLAMPTGMNHYAMLSAAGDAVWSVIKNYVGPAVECMDWIRDCAKRCAAVNRPLLWVAPNGFPVVMRYHKTEQRVVKTALGDKMRRIMSMRVEAPLPELCQKRMAAGSSPNYIHSIDASVLTGTVLRAATLGVSSLSVIHDSYSAPAPDMPMVNTAIRETVLDIFDRDPLEEFRQCVSETLGEEVEPYPKLDEFNRHDVLQSEYFFA